MKWSLVLVSLLVACDASNPQFEVPDIAMADGDAVLTGPDIDESQIADAAVATDAAIDTSDGFMQQIDPVPDGAVPSPPDLASNACGTGTQDCDENPLTACDPLDTALHCGNCSTSCFPAGGTNACQPQAGTYSCHPACDATHYDCDASRTNGCEVDLTADPGEPDNACPGEGLLDVVEGTTLTVSNHRILPAADTDDYYVRLKEGTHVCTPLSAQSYVAIVTLTEPAATPLVLGLGVTPTACVPAPVPATNGQYCYSLAGTCGFDDEATIYFQVAGATATTASCLPYTVTVRFCALGSTCDNCL